MRFNLGIFIALIIELGFLDANRVQKVEGCPPASFPDIDGSQEVNFVPSMFSLLCKQVKLECGVTRYRSFLGTNMSPDWAKIPEEHMSDPLSCFVSCFVPENLSHAVGQVLVHSSDDQIMLVQRKDPILGSRWMSPLLCFV
eukprot:108123-Hanusia_phi.AAC.2